MKREALRRTLALALSLLLAAALAPSALAAEAGEAEEAGEKAAEEERVLDTAELDELIEGYLDEHKRNKSNVAVAYTYLETGETYAYNTELWCYPASIFKLPEMMLITNDVATGKLAPDDRVCGCPLPTALETILVYSQTELAITLFDYLGGQGEYRRLSVELAGWDETQMPKGWEKSPDVNVLLINAWLQKLYDDPDSYPGVIEAMLRAQPGQYLRHNLDERYEIAQKYGAYEEVHHACGIIYMPHPVLVTVMTRWAGGGEELIGEIAELLADYTLTLDERLEQQREARRAEEERLAEEARKAEEERLAAEAKQAEEAEKARLAEESRKAEEERLAAKARRAEEQRQAAEEERAESARLWTGLALGAAVVLALAALGLRRRRVKRKSKKGNRRYEKV